MDRKEQKNFVESLSGKITEDILEQIDACNVPDSWDGIELRMYVAEKFRRALPVLMSQEVKRSYAASVSKNNL